MKKIITLIVILLSVSQSFAETNFSNNGNQNKLFKENELLKIKIENSEEKNNFLDIKIETLENKIKELDNNYSDLKSEKKNILVNINFLNKENTKLKNEIINFKKKTNSNYFKEKVIKEYFSDKISELVEIYNTDEGKFFLLILYLSTSTIIFLFFLIYTLPLRLLRGIWRIITGYKEPITNNEGFNKLITKYRILKSEQEKKSIKCDDFSYRISELEKINKKLRNQNANLKYEIKNNKKIKQDIQKREENIFTFEEKKVNIAPENNIFIPKEKNIVKTNKKSFLTKNKTDLFGKTKKEKFSLGGNKKGGLFDK